jgi:hypothetical protein
MMEELYVPVGLFAVDDDPAARQRAILAERLRRNEEVVVTPSGELEEPDPNDDSVKLKAPKGELAI